MKGTKYLSELITSPSAFRKGFINIINAGTSGGKTYFALTTLPKWAGSPEKILYLIDTNNGELAIQKNIITTSRQEYSFNFYNTLTWGDIQATKDKMPVMTYAGFGAELRQTKLDFWKQFEFIICDELHNLGKYLNIKEKSDQPKNRNLLATTQCLSYIARNTDTIVIGLTATPQGTETLFPCMCHYVSFDRSALICPETFHTQYYSSAQQILLKEGPRHTGILYIQSIEGMKKYIDFARQCGFRANGFWSINASEVMTHEQEALRQTVLNKETIPDDIDLLVINAASETCIKIQSKNRIVDYMIIHHANEVVQTQVRGRYCGDLDRLYLHDANAPLIAEAVPKEFLGRPLFSEEKDELCKLLNLPNPDNGRLLKWPSIKKILSKSGYMVSEGRSGNLRYSVIRLA